MFLKRLRKLQGKQMEKKICDLPILTVETLLSEKISQPNFRDDLIDALLAAQLPASSRAVHCIAVIIDFENTKETSLRQQKAERIIKIFIDKTSNFHVDGIPSALEKQLLNSQFQALIEVKNHLIKDLATLSVTKQVILSNID